MVIQEGGRSDGVEFRGHMKILPFLCVVVHSPQNPQCLYVVYLFPCNMSLKKTTQYAVL